MKTNTLSVSYREDAKFLAVSITVTRDYPGGATRQTMHPVSIPAQPDNIEQLRDIRAAVDRAISDAGGNAPVPARKRRGGLGPDIGDCARCRFRKSSEWSNACLACVGERNAGFESL